LLRQQLIVLNRQVKRPQLSNPDRFRLVLLSRFTTFWKQALHIVQPDTLLRWHRELFSKYWRTNFVHIITGDNGKEFAEYVRIAETLKANFYFAHPYSAWECSTNENTNGLVRQYFPKKTDFSLEN